jgi:hypothetical protein
MEWWDKWVRHRVEIKKRLTPTQTETQLRKFEKWGPERSADAIEYTIGKGWQGIREDDNRKPEEDTRTNQDRIADIMRKSEEWQRKWEEGG